MTRFINRLCLAISLIMAAPNALHAVEEPVDVEEFEAPPEGYEEKRFNIRSLTTRPAGFTGDFTSHSDIVPALNGQEVIDIVRYCVAPETWTRRGPARIVVEGDDLVVLQKKEVHPEIAKVLRWLELGIAAQFRGTVVVAALKPEAVRTAAAGGGLTPAELAKLLEDAASSEIVELRGVEGQYVFVSGTSRQHYTGDFDVSGAAYDPVTRTASNGLIAGAVAYRHPDCAGVQLDLDIQQQAEPRMEKAKVTIDGVIAAGVELPAETEEQKEPRAVLKNGKAMGFKGTLNIDLPAQSVASLRTTLSVPRGKFVLAGVLDRTLAAAKDKAPERLAIFVRASVGEEGVPTLEGVSGLKEGESFRLYPMTAAAREVPQFPGPMFTGQPTYSGSLECMNQFGNPFAAAAPANKVNTQTQAVSKAQGMFVEKVRKNKIVEARGPVVFTRLNAEDHARLLKNLMDDVQRNAAIRVSGFAVAVPQAAYRKIALEQTNVFEAASVDAIAKGEGAKLLAEMALVAMPRQRSHTVCGVRRHTVADYDISGDAYDPAVSSFLERGYVFDICPIPSADDARTDVELRFQAMPGQGEKERTVLDAVSVANGATSETISGLHADLERIKLGIVSVRNSSGAVHGKYVLAGSVRMPADAENKDESRQALIFLRVDPLK